MTLDNFGIVGNEPFRQGMGGVISWEQGVGPREADTVYVRSHEYGVQETVDGFDPAKMKISFLYFGTRERLSVEDATDGLVIWSLPTGQSLTLTNVNLVDLVPGLVEFHHNQVMDDNLEDPFGFSQQDVSLLSRAELLTPNAPGGATTDGEQIREGTMTSDNTGEGDGDVDATGTNDSTPDVLEIVYDWGAMEVIADFDVETDSFDFGALAATEVSVTEQNGELIIEVLKNGGHSYALVGLQAEDLSVANLSANSNSVLLDEDSAFMATLRDLGFDLG